MKSAFMAYSVSSTRRLEWFVIWMEHDPSEPNSNNRWIGYLVGSSMEAVSCYDGMYWRKFDVNLFYQMFIELVENIIITNIKAMFWYVWIICTDTCQRNQSSLIDVWSLPKSMAIYGELYKQEHMPV